MIRREITPVLIKLFQQYPFVTLTGPRQSGKTTLFRMAFPELKYVNLEAPDQRDFAESDPRGFLSRLGTGAILDEIQRVPDLPSYLQVLADEEGRNSLFVLTGSEQLRISESISQSLAGRTALLRLLPFSLAEREETGATIASDYFRALKRVAKVLPRISSKSVVYGGVAGQFRRDADVAPLADLPKMLERYDGRDGT